MVLFYEKKNGPTNDVILISFEKYSQNFHFFFFFFCSKIIFRSFHLAKTKWIICLWTLKYFKNFKILFYEEKSLSNWVF